MKVALYARVSTEDQELQQQIASCQRFCQYKGYDIAKIFSEKVSGYKVKRPQ
jgi:DNA invertase Pin-like site-specific DNA recombinase